MVHANIVSLLLQKDAKTDQRIKDGWTPLLIAAQQGHLEVVRCLIEEGKVNVNQALTTGETPLHVAVQNSHEAVVKLLIESGAVVNQQANNGWTPLLIAAQQGHTEVVRLLIEVGKADVDKANNIGNTALHIAAQNGHLEIVELLLTKDGNLINTTLKNGATPLLVAAQHGNLNIVQCLLLCYSLMGCSPEEINKGLVSGFSEDLKVGSTALNFALRYKFEDKREDNLKIAIKLINAGIDCSNVNFEEKQQILEYFSSNQSDLNEILRFFEKTNKLEPNALGNSLADLLLNLDGFDKNIQALFFSTIYCSILDGEEKKKILSSLIGKGHSIMVEYVKNPLKRYFSGQIASKIDADDEDYDAELISETQYRCSDDKFLSSFQGIFDYLVRAEFQYLSESLNKSSSSNVAVTDTRQLTSYQRENKRQKKTPEPEAKIKELLSNDVLSFIFYSQLVNSESLEEILQQKFGLEFDFSFLLDIDLETLSQTIRDRFKEYDTYLEKSIALEPNHPVYKELFRLGIGKGKTFVNILINFLLRSQIITTLNTHNVAQIDLAKIILESKNLEDSTSYIIEDLTKLELLLDIKLLMDELDKLTFEKDFTDDDNLLMLDELQVEDKDTYKFQAHDDSLIIHKQDQDITLSFKDLPLELLSKVLEDLSALKQENQRKDQDRPSNKKQKTTSPTLTPTQSGLSASSTGRSSALAAPTTAPTPMQI